jgi:hypothetical protein
LFRPLGGIVAAVVFALTAWLSGCGGPATWEIPPERMVHPTLPRPSHYGLAVAVPRFLPLELAHLTGQLGASGDILLRVRIDSTGQVAAVTPVRDDDSIYAEVYQPILDSAVFAPALKDSVPTSSTLPVILRVNPRAVYPAFQFPVNQLHEIEERSLYYDALALNGVSPPAVARFPSYFFKPDSQNSATYLPRVHGLVSLDTSGRAQYVSLVESTAHQFTEEILTAMNWAEYRPLRIDGEARACSLHVVIMLYPELSYPVSPWRSDALDTTNMLHRTRVQDCFDTLGLMLQPVPRNLSRGTTVPVGFEGEWQGTRTLNVVVNKQGKSSVIPSRLISTSTLRALQNIIGQLKFYPAIGFDGMRQSFRGSLDLEFSGSKSIRIRCRWLFPPKFPVSP